VTFHKAVHARSVTLDGVVYDPAGTLTGGSRPQGTSLLEQLQKINYLKEQLRDEEGTLQRLSSQIANMKESSIEYQVSCHCFTQVLESNNLPTETEGSS